MRSSSSQNSSRSLPVMSARLPSEAKDETPSRRSLGELDQRQAEGAALGGEGDVAGGGALGAKVALSARLGVGVEDAEAVGADQPHPGLAADREQLALALGALLARSRRSRRRGRPGARAPLAAAFARDLGHGRRPGPRSPRGRPPPVSSATLGVGRQPTGRSSADGVDRDRAGPRSRTRPGCGGLRRRRCRGRREAPTTRDRARLEERARRRPGRRGGRGRSKRSRAAAENEVGNSTRSRPGSASISTGKPLSRNISIIRWFCGSTSATKVAIAVLGGDLGQMGEQDRPQAACPAARRRREGDLGAAARGRRRRAPWPTMPRSPRERDQPVALARSRRRRTAAAARSRSAAPEKKRNACDSASSPAKNSRSARLVVGAHRPQVDGRAVVEDDVGLAVGGIAAAHPPIVDRRSSFVRPLGRERTNAARVTVAPMLYFSHPACLEHDPRQGLSATRSSPSGCGRSRRRWRSATGWAGSGARRRAASEEELELVHPRRARRADPRALPLRRRRDRRRHLRRRGLLRGGAARGRRRLRDDPRAARRRGRRSASAPCARPATTPNPSGRWASASSTTSPSPPRWRSPSSASSGCFILDWDVHHGNGTAEIFRRRADVLFASIHQGGIFPGTGALGDVGSGPGRGLHDQPAGAGRQRARTSGSRCSSTSSSRPPPSSSRSWC